MQSCSNDWAETFQYLSREIFTPDIIATDLQQQVPTPPVCFGPFPQIFAAALTLPWSAPIIGLGYLLALPRREYDCYLGLEHLLSRGRPGPGAFPRFDTTEFGFCLLFRPQHGTSAVLQKLVQLPHSTIPSISSLRGWLAPGDHCARGQSRSQYPPSPPLHDSLLALLSFRRHHIEGLWCPETIRRSRRVVRKSRHMSLQPRPVQGSTPSHRTLRPRCRT